MNIVEFATAISVLYMKCMSELLPDTKLEVPSRRVLLCCSKGTNFVYTKSSPPQGPVLARDGCGVPKIPNAVTLSSFPGHGLL